MPWEEEDVPFLHIVDLDQCVRCYLSPFSVVMAEQLIRCRGFFDSLLGTGESLELRCLLWQDLCLHFCFFTLCAGCIEREEDNPLSWFSPSIVGQVAGCSPTMSVLGIEPESSARVGSFQSRTN